VSVADLYLRRSILGEGQGSRGLDEEKYLEKQVKEVYDAIEKAMNNDELNDEGKKTAIKNILFDRFASQDSSQRIDSQTRLDSLMRLEARQVPCSQKIHELLCCIKRSKPEFKDPNILGLIQEYCNVLVAGDNYQDLVDTFVENFRQQTGEGLGRRGGSGPSTSVAGGVAAVYEHSPLVGRAS
jgi:hypothetical protein